jgi:hypothetical protein
MSGALGPNYSYADELKGPSEIGVREGGSPGAITDAVAGVNYYVDAIGFGQSTSIAKANGLENQRLGLRYFLKTGSKCSNGADMYEYVDTVPKPLPGRLGSEIRQSLGVDMRGLAPGIIQDAAGALNPLPLFQAATGSGYAQCKKVTLPVGDDAGRVKSRYGGADWIEGPIQWIGEKPHQTRWVFDRYIESDAYDKTAKTEGFADGPSSQTIAAGVLFSALLLGFLIATKTKK